MQLLCFTFAGGTAAFYDQINPYLKENIRMVKFEYAGHGSRYKELLCNDFKEIAKDFYGKMIPMINSDKSYALMGYSMGTITLVEVMREIIEHGDPLPKHIFLAAHEPCSKLELDGYTADELDKYVRDRTLRFGGIPEKLINNKSFWRVYLPIYRNDYSMIGKYNFESLDLKIDVPATVFYSEEDTPYAEMQKWSRFFVKDIDFYQYTGNHFFIQEHCKEICDVINRNLTNLIDGGN